MKITKEEIMNVALIVFSEKGYDNTILKDISDRLHVTKSALYKHYESKEALWEALIDYVEKYYSENFGDNESIVIPNSLEELTELSLRQIQFTMNDDMVKRTRKLLVLAQYRNERMKELATKYFYSNMLLMYTSIFKGMADKGIIDVDNPELLAFEYTVPITTLIHIYDREPEREQEIKERINEHINYFQLILKSNKSNKNAVLI